MTRQFRTLVACALPALLLGACNAPYDQVASCADMTTAVWPWQPVRSTQVERVALPDPAASPYPPHLVRITEGTSVSAAPPVFECRFEGPFLSRVGWSNPPVVPAR